MVKVIDIPDDSGSSDAFEKFCEQHDIAVMDRAEIFEIYDRSGPGYALRRWKQMQWECR